MPATPTTRWSLIHAARGDSREARGALEALCAVYRPVVLAYFRRHGRPAWAEDSTQGFFLHFLEHQLGERVDRARGSFRAFLFTAVENHRRECLRAEHAAKRQADLICGQDIIERIADDNADLPRLFDRDWALLVVSRARDRLREEAVRTGKSSLFDALQEFLGEAPEGRDYTGIGLRFNMPANTVAVAVKRMRERLRSLLRRELADTLAPGVDVDAELDWLKQALRSP